MGNRNNEARGVLMRTKAYFNSSIFSDIEFQVKDTDGQIKIFYAHKLILAMAGEGFAKLFYNSKAPQTNTIKIAEFTPYIVHLMLKYIYSDKITFTTFEDATNLFKLAKRFTVSDLMVECDSYLSQYQVNINTLFAKYENALTYQQRDVLHVCRRMASSDTKAVFESPYFCTASRPVIVDILKLNELSVSSELEVIEAALKWCKAECRRRSRPSEEALCIRDDFLPLCKHLRFICLRIDEFLDFEERNKIFTSTECIKLTSKILNKDDRKLPIPTEFSTICRQRCSLVNDISSKNVPEDVFNSNDGNAAVSSHSLPSVAASNFQQTSPKALSEAVNPSYFSYTAVSSENAMKPKEDEIFHYIPPQRKAPVHKVIPQPKSNSFMSFEFPLHEMQKEMASAINNDLKCHAKINMFRGTMRINALELRIKEVKNYEESIEVHLCFTNKAAPKSRTQDVLLKNSVLYLPFSDPYIVAPNDPLDIEVTIEDLKLNRCSVCRFQESYCELNCGLNVTAEINLSSNQSNGTDSFFFLISKIHYSIP